MEITEITFTHVDANFWKKMSKNSKSETKEYFKINK